MPSRGTRSYWSTFTQRVKITKLIFLTVLSSNLKYLIIFKTLFCLLVDGEVRFSPTDLHGENYHLVGVDLRQLSEVQKKLNDSEVNWNTSTLILSECVLVYVEPEHIRALLTFLSTQLTTALFVNYEQVNMDDRFGQIMLTNLRARGCALAGVEACRDLASQQQRYYFNSSACQIRVTMIFLQIFGYRLGRV